MSMYRHTATKVAIIGAGLVGSTIAYTLMLSGTVSDIVLIDIKKEKAEGEMLDLAHCMQFTNAVHLEAGDDFSLLRDAMIIIITAGVAQQPGQSRTDLLQENVTIFKEIIPNITKHNNNCIILVVTNPLDVLTYVTWQLSKFPACRVFGAGTVLDTARLRYLIGTHYNISPKDIIAYILGEHGDSEFVWWSNATIAGVPLSKFSLYDSKAMEVIYQKTKNAAYEIIEKKGATYYAIALVVSKIVRAIILDQSRVFSISTVIENIDTVESVCLSIPTIVRQSGVCEHLILDLNIIEQEQYLKSAKKVRHDIELALKKL